MSSELKLNSSIYIIGYISFLGDMSRGVIFPILWKLTSQLGGNITTLGYLIASFSFGRMVFGPILGYICDYYSHKLSLLIASFILIFGSLLMSFIYELQTLELLFLSQFLLGCGSGSLGVTRAYIVETCPKKRLTEVLAYMNALQFAGFTVSPVFGSGLSYVGVFMNSQFFVYFFPSISIAAAASFSIYLLFFNFEDLKPSDLETKLLGSEMILYPAEENLRSSIEDIESISERRGGGEIVIITKPSSTSITDDQAKFLTVPSSTSSLSTSNSTLLRILNKCSSFFVISDMAVGYLVLILVNVTARGSIAIYETMSPRIADLIYNMSTLQLGIIISTLGFIGTLQLVFFKFLWSSTQLNDIQLMSIGVATMAIASYIIFDYEYELVSVVFYIFSISFLIC